MYIIWLNLGLCSDPAFVDDTKTAWGLIVNFETVDDLSLGFI
jgi:hypothetical protein